MFKNGWSLTLIMSDTLFTGGYTTSSLKEFSVFSRRDSDAKSEPDKKVKSKKFLLPKVMLTVVLVLVAIVLVMHFVVMPNMEPVEVSFSGTKTLTRNQLQEIVNEINAGTWMQFDSAKAVSVISSIPCVEQVTVDKHFPNVVSIRIREREAVAKTIVSINGHSAPIQIDKNGVLFSSNVVSELNDSSIPLISGLPLENVHEGMRLPGRYRNLVEQIAGVRELEQKYFAAISEIRVVPKDYGNYELILYPIHTRVKVLMDSKLDEDALRKMIVALDVVNSMDPDAVEINLRYGAVSYSANK